MLATKVGRISYSHCASVFNAYPICGESTWQHGAIAKHAFRRLVQNVRNLVFEILGRDCEAQIRISSLPRDARNQYLTHLADSVN